MRLAAMVSLVFLHVSATGLLAQGAAKTDPYRAEVMALSRRIDHLIEAKWKDAGMRASPMAHDGQYFRRLNLDLTGRIPNLLDIRDYMDRKWADEESAPSTVAGMAGLLAAPHGIATPSTGLVMSRSLESLMDKRWDWVEKMLSEETYGRHFAAFWRSQILAGNTNQQAQGLQPGFENWLRQHLHNNTPYDKMVRELLTAAPFGGGNMYQGGASPAAFYFANENKPENLAGASARMFLGVKLDCAQCHPHPFAKWTRNQFWEFAAFFGQIQPNVRRPGIQPVAQPNGGREIMIPGTNKTVKAKFLNGAEPTWKDGVDSRTILADWVTSPENPFFAKAAVDHLWSYFFGVSLLEPIYEPNEDYPVVHEELVDEMARQLIAQKFDLKFLIRAIVHTRAYQRTSESRDKEPLKDDILFFARMPVRGLSPEQIFDSLEEATRDRVQIVTQPTPINPNPFQMQTTPRGEFIAKFTTQDKKHETQTSILQALMMMNGKYLAERTRFPQNLSLQTLANQKEGGTAKKVDTLFMMVLSRPPRPEEAERFIRYVDTGGPTKSHGQALADVYWVLLNSGEFLLNH
jgi:hypothetical protein